MSCAATSRRGPDDPNPFSDAQISRGCLGPSVAASTPSLRAADGRKLSTMMSARARRASSTARASGERRFSVTLRLPRLRRSKYGPNRRMPSPPFGSSILVTSAPSPPSRCVAYAPGSSRVRSMTRTPSSGSTAQPAVVHPVAEIQDKPDGQPHDESNPGDQRQLEHQVHAHDNRPHGDQRHQRRSKRPGTAGIDAPEHDDADRDERSEERR